MRVVVFAFVLPPAAEDRRAFELVRRSARWEASARLDAVAHLHGITVLRPREVGSA